MTATASATAGTASTAAAEPTATASTEAGPASAADVAAAAPIEAAATVESWRRHLRSGAELLWSRTVLRRLKPLYRLALESLNLRRPVCLRRRAILLRSLVSSLRLAPERHNTGRLRILSGRGAILILLRRLVCLSGLALECLHSRSCAVLP